MQEPPIPPNEAERLELLHQLNILDTTVEEVYDGITYIASHTCGMPLSLITLIDRDRQWFKSVSGGTIAETSRIYSFCAHAILKSEILEVPDSLKDDRFKDNPFVTGKPYVRAYAGAPLELKNGLRVGTLCVVDHKPHKLTEEQLKILHFLSLQVVKLLELRLKVKEVETLRQTDANIVHMLTHELRNPLVSIAGYFSMTQNKENYHDNAYDLLIGKCSKNLDRMLNIVNQFLNYANWQDESWTLQKRKNDLNACIREGISLTKDYRDSCKVAIDLYLDKAIPFLNFNYDHILHVLENLLSNAAKYSSEGGKIVVFSEKIGNGAKVKIQDFGIGISKSDQDKLFQPFALQDQETLKKRKSAGLCLSIAKKIIEKHGGEMGVESTENKGSTFYFTLPLSPILPPS
jgi:signal transduction histidine kinase